MGQDQPLAPFVRLLTDRVVEQFLLRLFLRDEAIKSLCLVSPFMDPLPGSRFSLADLSRKIRQERIPTFVVTRKPVDDYQCKAISILNANEYVEIRYNESLHAKVFIADAWRQAESFALFGSGNLTGPGFASPMSAHGGNLEAGVIFAPGGLEWLRGGRQAPATLVTNLLPLQGDDEVSADAPPAAGTDTPEPGRAHVAPPAAENLD